MTATPPINSPRKFHHRPSRSCIVRMLTSPVSSTLVASVDRASCKICSVLESLRLSPNRPWTADVHRVLDVVARRLGGRFDRDDLAAYDDSIANPGSSAIPLLLLDRILRLQSGDRSRSRSSPEVSLLSSVLADTRRHRRDLTFPECVRSLGLDPRFDPPREYESGRGSSTCASCHTDETSRRSTTSRLSRPAANASHRSFVLGGVGV